ncbi:hypothetical protein LLE49_03560 [Alicyclobacillus tolerans]|uniref:hypothetical protein n=1 Tax=Alicyclobacillus tolerans TaxID=90970 RepID=UPI001F38FDDB|nr:hypothetical protein [Alicyclobacillus tolerans]MCF8563816.1 hypothetical protein [Alicyclobacillus tolerans]
MATKEQCEQYVGKWVNFRTRYGYHVGIVERVTDTDAIILSPRKFVPAHLQTRVSDEDSRKLDAALAWGGGGGGYPGGGAFGGRPGWGGGGYPAWGWGWGRWAVSFLIIYVLWGLWW